MKILQTPVRFHPFVGGVENYVHNLSKELIELGHEVTVVCANEPEVKSKETIDGINVKRLNYIGKIANTNITLKLPLELVKEYFDLIHTHIPTPWSADWSAIISKIKNRPLILTYHNDIVGTGIANSIAQFYNLTSLKLVLKRADRIIITQPGYLESSPYLKHHEHKIEVIPVGVDTERFTPVKMDKEENVLFFLSVLDAFHEYKGLQYLIKALAIVKGEIRDVKLIVGGDGELLEYYKRIAESMNLKDNIEFVGFIPDKEIVAFYNKCDVFVLPSSSRGQEGFGMVLLEAMACEKPVIATDIVGAAKEIKECNAGMIVMPKDVKGLANAIINVLQDKKIANEMGKNGRILIEKKYSWERIVDSLLEVYQKCLYPHK